MLNLKILNRQLKIKKRSKRRKMRRKSRKNTNTIRKIKMKSIISIMLRSCKLWPKMRKKLSRLRIRLTMMRP